MQAQGRQRIGALAQLPLVLRSLGADPASVCAAAGLEPELLRNEENALSFEELGRLLAAAEAATGRRDLGLHLGAKGGAHTLGLIGRYLATAPILGEAIRDLCVNHERYIQGACAYLYLQDDLAFWGYAIYAPVVEDLTQLKDASLLIARNVMQTLCGATPDLVLFARPAPADIGPYRAAFGCELRFDADQHALVFPRRLLETPVQGADPNLRRLLKDQVARYWAAAQPDLRERVMRVLRAEFLAGGATRERTASTLGLHPRTLNRRLEAAGHDFRGLRESVRFEIGRQLLTGTRLPISEVALALGYADQSAFTHAFRRWAGMPPSQWRAWRDGGGGDVDVAPDEEAATAGEFEPLASWE